MTLRTPTKRRREKSCSSVPEKRPRGRPRGRLSGRPRRRPRGRPKGRKIELLTFEEEDDDVEGEDNVTPTEPHNEGLANDFERMKLQFDGKQVSPSDKKNTGSGSGSTSSSDENTVLSLSDDELTNASFSRRQSYRKKERLTEFSKTNIFTRTLAGKENATEKKQADRYDLMCLIKIRQFKETPEQTATSLQKKTEKQPLKVLQRAVFLTLRICECTLYISKIVRAASGLHSLLHTKKLEDIVKYCS
uniref:Uncharacterized protein n=1 Tax=Setaria digitata TaxID=48799 RepID=A0A915PTA2_9BILA